MQRADSRGAPASSRTYEQKEIRQMKETIGFLVLGHMGQPMAENFLKAGYRLKVYNRTASKMELFVAQGVEAASQPSAALVTGGIVVSMVSDDAALEEIVR